MISDRFGNLLQQMSFDAFGARRNPATTASPWVTLPILGQQNFDTSHTTHGYTGHEGADKVGLIHMNGRMYDPVLGRFIQADSIVQDPYDPQSLNRYAYVLNNPLTATDPSGNISFKNALKLGIAIAITVYTAGASAELLANGLIGQALATAAAGGALSGAVTGGLKGAVTGAFTSAAFFGVGEAFSGIANAQQATNLASTTDVVKGLNSAGLTAGQTVAKIAAHGAVGGAMGVLQGGKFGHGFVTAGLNESLSGKIGRIRGTGGQVAASAILGGTTSSLVGGKFANGAITAAFSYAFARAAQSRSNYYSRVSADDDLSGVPTEELRVKMRGTPKQRLSAAKSASKYFGIDDNGVLYQYNTNPRANAGQMGVNGTVTLAADAFSSWSQLGSVLGHEIEVHWQRQILLRGWGNDDTHLWIGEFEAYKYNIDNARRFGNNANQIEDFRFQMQAAFKNISPSNQKLVLQGRFDEIY